MRGGCTGTSSPATCCACRVSTRGHSWTLAARRTRVRICIDRGRIRFDLVSGAAVCPTHWLKPLGGCMHRRMHCTHGQVYTTAVASSVVHSIISLRRRTWSGVICSTLGTRLLPPVVVSATTTSSPLVRVLGLLLGLTRPGNTDGATLNTCRWTAAVFLAWTPLSRLPFRDDLFRVCAGTVHAAAVLLAAFPSSHVPTVAAKACLAAFLLDPAAALGRHSAYEVAVLDLVAAFLLGVSSAVCTRQPPTASTLARFRLPAWPPFARGWPAYGLILFLPRRACMRLILFCTCPPLCKGALWPIPPPGSGVMCDLFLVGHQSGR